MVSNPDPRPGRWVLPLVVLGMILFTWVWVNRLEPPAVEITSGASGTTRPTTATTAAVEDTSAGDGGTETTEDTTPTTLLPPEIEVYLTNLAEDKTALAALVEELNAVNDAWENRDETGVTFAESEAGMVAASERAVVFSEAVELHRPPEDVAGLTDAHQRVYESAAAVAEAAAAALAGLRAPDTGEDRRAAMVEFRAAAASFEQQVDQISEIVRQGFGAA
ncbi:MAG: hypothetical protein F4176_01770 [Acidimicrobiia bacterium]|nr:hypothetical protein [Acidimicrobiia bacterium]